MWVKKIQAAIDYIERHLFEDITVESVGKAVYYAPSSIAGIFSAVTGYSIGEYIRFRRLSCAAERLVNGDVSVTEAALLCAYESTEAFSHVDWSDTQRQNEFVNCVVSALTSLGEKLDYDHVCAISGSAFRTSFSMPSACEWNHDGRVLLGYNPFMNVEDDHNEAPDDTGYFRKSDWHDGFFAKGSGPHTHHRRAMREARSKARLNSSLIVTCCSIYALWRRKRRFGLKT